MVGLLHGRTGTTATTTGDAVRGDAMRLVGVPGAGDGDGARGDGGGGDGDGPYHRAVRLAAR
ncbi:hypothetical protein AN221_43400 [Streptomyces nanshensis]|uniref:Uncharacterized protein n=1 Tax=Streptomyces nanshensis TaxID=518642 RepID=A0A1E7LEY7_9ACTN|nr:hypothetical protein AN221_43400 [Streptomyces nanshensis]